MKVETDIIASITASPIVRVINVIYVETFKTDIIVIIDNAIM